jgi:hypothetical protein
VVLINDKAADDAAVNDLWVAIDDVCKFRPSKDTLHTLVDVDRESRLCILCDSISTNCERSTLPL